MEEENDVKLSKAEFWMRIAGASFGLWSLMIPIGIWMLSNTFERASKNTLDSSVEIVQFNRRFETYVLNMERRITIIEERQNRVLNTLEDIASTERFKFNGKNK